MLALPFGGAAMLMTSATPAVAQTTLPAPYVSRALDALLLPIDDSVRDTFGLSADDTGVFILATAPDGLADAAGLEPGDVVDFVRGEAILSPADLDAVVWGWINQGISDFQCLLTSVWLRNQ
jgi:S1-C subfamily serine protease